MRNSILIVEQGTIRVTRSLDIISYLVLSSCITRLDGFRLLDSSIT